MSTEELAAWIRLTLEPGLGAGQARQLLSAFGLPHDIFAQPAAQLRRHLEAELAAQVAHSPAQAIQAQIDHTLKWLEHPNHHLLTLADPQYPKALLEIHDPPLALYVNGRVELLNLSALAIVGARSSTPAGEENAFAFAEYLARHQWCIVSGLASGIDAGAHRGALHAGQKAGGTIAVLATGIDLVYPARNRKLAHEIAEKGALVSEFPIGQKAWPYHFPKRNRIVAGLARGVLVVEAALQSGSLITARLASEMGREVFAIPGSIHSPLSKGCHVLIRQGAKLVESGQDIHEELRPGTAPDETAFSHNATQKTPSLFPKPDTPEPDSANQNVLEALGYDPVSLDLLQQRTAMPTPQLNRCLSMLELKGYVVRLSNGQFQRSS